MPDLRHGADSSIAVRPSPLIELIAHLASQYPDVETDVIDKVAIESKCIREDAESLLADFIRARQEIVGRERSRSVDEWMSRFSARSSMPSAQMKVYPLP